MVSILLIDSGHGCGMPHSVLPPEGFRVMTDIWAQLNIQSDFRVIAARGLTTESFTTGGRAGWGECGGESKDFLIYFLFKEIVQPLQREWLCVLWLRSTLNPMLRHDRFSLSLFFFAYVTLLIRKECKRNASLHQNTSHLRSSIVRQSKHQCLHNCSNCSVLSNHNDNQ